MYMPGTKDISSKLLSGRLAGLTSFVLCFEDACPADQVVAAEKNVHSMLDKLAAYIESKVLPADKLPLIFIRVRNIEQFDSFARNLTKRRLRPLCGFVFPKFSAAEGHLYFEKLISINKRFSEKLYGMPIIESTEVAYKETRLSELLGIKKILNDYRELVLQVRVGATDFSSVFGVRRGVDYSIYDITTVRDCLSDIVNVFGRNNDFIVSGPVWEYFRAPEELMFDELPSHGLEDYLMKRLPIVNQEIDGLLREVILDKANGFVGRTVIHPTHIKYVNALNAVTKEEYEDARMILGNSHGGVVKSAEGNKMNEIKPHTNWASKIINRARAFGVIENEAAYIRLFI